MAGIASSRASSVAQASIRECTQEEIGATTRLGASMQPAMEAGNPAKGKPAQATEHGEVEDHKAHGCRDFDHGDQIVDRPGPDRWRCCPRTVRQASGL
jgi:hypothetical protein